MPDLIKTPTGNSEYTLKEKGSEFISVTKPVNSQNEALEFLNAVRKKYFSATHHCYSWLLSDGNAKYSDDGEPTGTAGIRIRNAQNHFELTNLITVVIRFFGGVKLGVGLLGKTYYEAARLNLEGASIEEKKLYRGITLTYNFDQAGNLHHLISKYNVIQKNNRFESIPIFEGMIPSILSNACIQEIESRYTPGIKAKLDESYIYR
jgi:putative IMPACT (imprinted ancient) family translation regulator